MKQQAEDYDCLGKSSGSSGFSGSQQTPYDCCCRAPANDFYLSTYVVLVFSDGSGSNVVTQSENSLKPLASVSQESSSHITASLIHYYAD